MNIAELSIKKSVITLTLTLVMLFVGMSAFDQLSRLEDPEFTIKDAVVMTPYVGASAKEVEEEVTDVIERAVQELGQLEKVESRSSRNSSIVKVTIKDKYDKQTLPQVWDELRRKVNDYQRFLPPGAGPSMVNDDFGDVYGVFLAITGEGYSYKELRDFAKFLRLELLQATDVKKIVFYGDIPEVIYVEMSRQKMSELGITQEKIYSALEAKNLVENSGSIHLGEEFIPIQPSGEFTSEKQFGDLLIGRSSTDRLIYLKDVADVKRGYKDPPDTIMRFDGKPAVGLGISSVLGGNVVTMGESLKKKFKEMEAQIPVGMNLGIISLQSESVTQSINGFLVNLGQAVLIVVVVLLFFMGLRSGLIIGAVLFLTICGTFIFMNAWNVTLERISLGALIIALGMLVDNAIVVTDGMRVKMEQGMKALQAAKEVVGQTAVPLLGATVVAVTAFAAIGTSQDSTGEYCRTLFQVILISLMLSWVTAVTITPLFCKMFLKTKKVEEGAVVKDPYAGAMFKIYKKFLCLCLKFRMLTVGVVVGLFVISLMGFGHVDQSFFPNSSRNQFYVDFWFPEGMHIKNTTENLKKAENYFLKQEGVEHVTTTVGGSQLRFLLTYTPENPYSSFGQIIVTMDDYKRIDLILPQVNEDLKKILPEAVLNVKKFALGPGDGGKIQLRIMGPNHEHLRVLSEKAKNVFYEDGGAQGVRDEWRQKVKVIEPQISEAPASRAGIQRPDVAKKIKSSFEGYKTGVYRENDDLLDIVARAPDAERKNVDNLNDLDIWSPTAQTMIPIRQVVSDFKVGYEDANIWRRARTPMIRIHADPSYGLPSELLARVKPKIEEALGVDVEKVLGQPLKSGVKLESTTLPIIYKDQMPLKGLPGYSLGWDGEAEDSSKAGAALAANLPIFGGIMVLIVICLFNAIRQPLIIWLCVPLAIIGVTAGLLLFKQPFGFMALLGLLSLSGMLIKNAIVLIDQINMDIKEGKQPLNAVIDSGVSRLNPVLMAAATTILGMIPLLKDPFFVSMAVTIMFGLGFATILTLVFVPVLYTLFFKIKYEETKVSP